MSEVREADEGGLRERKKLATRRAIERGAVELALKHGYENVTVEMICDSAVISQRTFFNYVGSKERAVLGIDPRLPSDELRRDYIAGVGGSPFHGLVLMLAAGFDDYGGTDTAIFRKRRQIIQANPDLAVKEFARMEEAETTVVDLVRERLCTDNPDREATDVDHEARMVFSMTFGIMHYTVRDWISDGFPGDVTDALRRAVDLARTVLRQ